MASIVTGKIPERPNHARFTDGLWELTQRCLKPTPSDRPHAEEVLVALKEIAGTNRVGTQESKTSSRQLVSAHLLYFNHSILFSSELLFSQSNR